MNIARRQLRAFFIHMIGLENKTLTSERLSYRLLEERDKLQLASLLSDAEVTRPAGFLPSKSASEFDDFFATLTQYNTGIAVLLGDVLIGYIHVNKYVSSLPELVGKPCVSTGFVIGKAFQRKGYGTEMLNTLTNYLLGRFSACFADCFDNNPASEKLIRKCGYEYFEDYTMFFDGIGETKTCKSFIHR